MTPSGYTVQDAASKLGIKYKALLKRIERGRVKASRVGSAAQSAYIIPAEEFDRLKILYGNRSTTSGGASK